MDVGRRTRAPVARRSVEIHVVASARTQSRVLAHVTGSDSNDADGIQRFGSSVSHSFIEEMEESPHAAACDCKGHIPLCGISIDRVQMDVDVIWGINCMK